MRGRGEREEEDILSSRVQLREKESNSSWNRREMGDRPTLKDGLGKGREK